MKVYDCFTFYNEFELLELRLKSLYDVVDYFVIVESNRTHTNKPKPINLLEYKYELKDFEQKIRHIVVDATKIPFKGIGDWSIENAQRNGIMAGLDDAKPDDLIFISDVDEIPAPDILQRISEKKENLFVPYFPFTRPQLDMEFPAKLLVPTIDFLDHSAIVMQQNLHYYYFDWISKAKWQGSILVKRKNLTIPQNLRNLRNFLPRIQEGGWHFSYMGGADRVIDKILSIVEGQILIKDSNKDITDREHIEESMANGTDIYNRNNIPESKFIQYDVRDLNLSFLKEFVKKYPYFLRDPEKYIDTL